MTKLIGIDFGTTNSVVAVLSPDGSVQTSRFAFGAAELDVFRTVLCFWSEQTNGRSHMHHAAGPQAIEAYLDDPLDSRLIMSMKTYLAQHSFTQTNIFGRIFTLEQMISLFLRALLGTGHAGAHITAGRPVRFAGDFADDDFGEARLRASYAAAGFPAIDVALEPQAAGYRFTRGLAAPATVLVGDFGGGTSDFSLLRFTPGDAHPVVSLGHSGIGIAGDTFDYRIIDNMVSPLLGKATPIRSWARTCRYRWNISPASRAGIGFHSCARPASCAISRKWPAPAPTPRACATSSPWCAMKPVINSIRPSAPSKPSFPKPPPRRCASSMRNW